MDFICRELLRLNKEIASYGDVPHEWLDAMIDLELLRKMVRLYYNSVEVRVQTKAGFARLFTADHIIDLKTDAKIADIMAAGELILYAAFAADREYLGHIEKLLKYKVGFDIETIIIERRSWND